MSASPESISEIATQPAAIPQGLSLRKNFAWTLAGNIVYAGCQWGMIVAIAKLGTPVMVGQFALGLAIAAPVFMLTNLQLRAVQATDTSRDFRFGDYLALRLLGTAVALLVVVGVTGLAGYRWETLLVILAVGLAKASESISDVIYGLLQNRERMDKIAQAMMGRGFGALAALAVVLYLTRNLALAVAALAAWWAGWLLVFERGVASRMLANSASPEEFRGAWEVERLKRLGVLALPLGVVMLLLSLNTNIPRYFVEHYAGEAALGYFAALIYLVIAGSMVINALGQSAVPRLAKYYQTDRRAFVRLLAKMVLLAATLGVGSVLVGVMAGGPLLTLLYRADYAQYADLLVWLLLAGAVSYIASIFGYGMTAARVFRAQVWLFSLATLTTALACWLLIPRLGLAGAAYAVLLGNVLSCGGAAFINAMALRTWWSKSEE